MIPKKLLFKLFFALFALMAIKEYIVLKRPAPAPLPPPTSMHLLWPLEGGKENAVINLGYGEDWVKSCDGTPKIHTGLDIKAKIGANVLAAQAGEVRVIYVVKDKYGKYAGKGIVIEHGGGDFTTVYMHIEPLFRENDHVEKGQVIATIADISGAHLHFGIRKAKYGEYATRGALPRIKTNDNNFCRDDPVFPDKFIDPLVLKYD